MFNKVLKCSYSFIATPRISFFLSILILLVQTNLVSAQDRPSIEWTEATLDRTILENAKTVSAIITRIEQLSPCAQIKFKDRPTSKFLGVVSLLGVTSYLGAEYNQKRLTSLPKPKEGSNYYSQVEYINELTENIRAKEAQLKFEHRELIKYKWSLEQNHLQETVDIIVSKWSDPDVTDLELDAIEKKYGVRMGSYASRSLEGNRLVPTINVVALRDKLEQNFKRKIKIHEENIEEVKADLVETRNAEAQHKTELFKKLSKERTQLWNKVRFWKAIKAVSVIGMTLAVGWALYDAAHWDAEVTDANALLGKLKLNDAAPENITMILKEMIASCKSKAEATDTLNDILAGLKHVKGCS